MLDISRDTTQPLQLFIFIREENGKFIGKSFVGYALEDIIPTLPPYHWIPIGGIPIKNIMKDVGYDLSLQVDKKIDTKPSVLNNFKASLLMTADKYQDSFTKRDQDDLKRIISKIPTL